MTTALFCFASLYEICYNSTLQKYSLLGIYNGIDSLADKIEEWFDISNIYSREEIAKKCFRVIDEKYNPHYQIEVLKQVLNK